MLLSKIIDNKNVQLLEQYSINEDFFQTEIEKEAYRFIKNYAYKNRNETPSYASVIQKVPNFHYHENVTDTYDYLIYELKNYYARLHIKDFLEKKALPKYNENNHVGIGFAKWVQEEMKQLVQKTETRQKVGINVKNDSHLFLEEYERRKKGESFTVWKSAFPTITKAITGYFSGNLYTYYGRSGRGKSVITLREAIESAFQGANVLIWAMEMSWFELMVRIYSMVSAKIGQTVISVEGSTMEGGFDTKLLSQGQLPDDFEEGFKAFLQGINEVLPGNITIRSVDHDDFVKRDLNELERDIEETKADFVIVDPFYYLHYEKDKDRKTGGAAEATSKKLRALAGKQKCVIIAITQAEELKQEKRNDDDKREIVLPERNAVKKTKALLEDCSNLFSVDNADGMGAISINKGRSGGEDVRAEILYLPSHGIVREFSTDETSLKQFNDTF